MAEFSALPLFTDAWIADTSHLGRAERGLYMDLLILCWRSPECRVPHDEAWVARKLKVSAEELPMLRGLISEFMSSSGNWLTQKRLQREFAYVREKSKKQSARAKSRWDKEKSVSRGNAEPHEDGMNRDDAGADDLFTSYSSALKTQGKDLCRGNAPTPSPTPTSLSEADASERRAKVSRGSRLPNDWEPLPGDVAFALAKGMGEQALEIEAMKFRNYWTSKAGQAATKLDWSRTWQNWVLNSSARSPPGGSQPRAYSVRDDKHLRTRSVLNALDNAIARDRAEPEGRGAGREDHPRLLPIRGCG